MTDETSLQSGHSSIQHKWLVRYVPVLLISLVFFSILQFSYDNLQQDDYFHIRYSQMIRQNGPYRTFPWLKRTILADRFYDMHFLYHILLLPLTFGNLIVSAKIASILLAAGAVLVLHWFLIRYEIRRPLFWSLLFMAGSHLFLTRLLALRPIALAMIFCLVCLFLLLEEKGLWLGVMSFVFVLSYSGFPILVIIVFVYALVSSIYYRRIEWKPPVFCLAGICAGLVINPYFPTDLRVLYVQIVKMGLAGVGLEPNLEWMPLGSWQFLLQSWGIFTVLCVIVLLLLLKKKNIGFKTLLFFVLSGVFFLLFTKYSRGVDYFILCAVLFCGFAFSALEMKRLKRGIIFWAFIAVLMGTDFYILERHFDGVERIDNSGSARWLLENTPAGSEVFIANYGAFPQLFFYNTHNVYTMGHDPLFMYEYDKALYESYLDALWLRKDPYPIIKNTFGSRWVHVENISKNRNFYRYMLGNPGLFKRVYQDDHGAVFEVVDTKQ